jgi:hypothetical protein
MPPLVDSRFPSNGHPTVELSDAAMIGLNGAYPDACEYDRPILARYMPRPLERLVRWSNPVSL